MMELDRAQLLDVLRNGEPALAVSAQYPVMGAFLFADDTVVSYNDRIAIMSPLETGIECAANGKQLIGLLDSSSAKTVHLTSAKAGDGATLSIKMGKFSGTLAAYPPSAFPFQLPQKTDGGMRIPLTDDLIIALRQGMKSVCDNPMREDYYGMTIIGGSNALTVYASDGICITRAALTGVKGFKSRIVLPDEFVRTLLSFTDREDHGAKAIVVAKDDAWAIVEFEFCTLFTKLHKPENPVDFESYIGRAEKDAGKIDPLLIPDELMEAVKRASILSEMCAFRFEAKSRKLLVSTSWESKSTESVPLDGAHPDLLISVEAARFRSMCDGMSHMRAIQRAVILTGEIDGVEVLRVLAANAVQEEKK